jgi:hypothetical protein
VCTSCVDLSAWFAFFWPALFASHCKLQSFEPCYVIFLNWNYAFTGCFLNRINKPKSKWYCKRFGKITSQALLYSHTKTEYNWEGHDCQPRIWASTNSSTWQRLPGDPDATMQRSGSSLTKFSSFQHPLLVLFDYWFVDCFNSNCIDVYYGVWAYL